LRAEAAGDLAVDDGGAEILLGGVVGRWDVRAVEEDEQASAMLAIAFLEAAGVGRVGLVRQEGAEDEAVDGVFDTESASSDETGVSVSRTWWRWIARPNRWRSSTTQTRPAWPSASTA